MKFIHTSDWHLGRQFHNVSLIDDQRHVLKQLIEHIQREAVDAVIISGDIYDRSVPPAVAVELLDEVLHAICIDLKVPVLLIPGNHDGAERLRFGARQLRQAGLHIFGDFTRMTEPVIIESASVTAAFYGIPYNDPETIRNQFSAEVSSHDEAHAYLLEQIKAIKANDRLNILISHCFIDGAEESDSERPLSIGGADRVSFEPFADFDYVALGHLHSPQAKGQPHIRYSGSILKYSFSEHHHNKGVTLVELAKSGLKSTTHLPLMPLRDMRILEGALADLVEQGKDDAKREDYLLVRLTDKHVILDPMGKLREVYPNVLHLEKPGLMATGDQKLDRDRLKRNELDLFRDFYQQVMGDELTLEQQQVLQKTIASLHKNAGEQA